MQPVAKALFSAPTQPAATKVEGQVEAGAEDGPFVQLVAALEAGEESGEGDEALADQITLAVDLEGGDGAIGDLEDAPAAGSQDPEVDEVTAEADWLALLLPLSAQANPSETESAVGVGGVALEAAVQEPGEALEESTDQPAALAIAAATATAGAGAGAPEATASRGEATASVEASQAYAQSAADGQASTIQGGDAAEADATASAPQLNVSDLDAEADDAPTDNLSQGGGNSLPTLNPPPWSTHTNGPQPEGAVAESSAGAQSAGAVKGLQAAASVAGEAAAQQAGDSDTSRQDGRGAAGDPLAGLAPELASTKNDDFAALSAEASTQVTTHIDALAGSSGAARVGAEPQLPTLDVLTLARDLEGLVKSQGREARIALNPAELGRIDVNVRLVEGRVEVMITAQSDHGYQALSSELRGLVDALRQADIPAVVKLSPADAGAGSRGSGASQSGQQSGQQSGPQSGPQSGGSYRNGTRQSFAQADVSGGSDREAQGDPAGRIGGSGPRHWLA